MRIAVIADTHDKYPPGFPRRLQQADEIWHLGDVCDPSIVLRLERITLVRVVRGNCDEEPQWPLMLDFELEGHRFHLEHIPTKYPPPCDVFLHGHTHVPRDETINGVMKFPDERLATFTCSFGAANHSSYQLVGTEGDLRVEPAYDYAVKLTHYLTKDGKTTKKAFAKRDHFGAELVYFSDCILNNRQPEPNGSEGLIDVRIIEAIHKSVGSGKWVSIGKRPSKSKRPSLRQEIRRPAVPREPPLVNTEAPHS